MSYRSVRLTDELLTRSLASRSADPDPGLIDAIVRAAAHSAQLRPWSREWFGLHYRWVGIGVALLAVAIGLSLVALGALPRPGDPTPTPAVTQLFNRPFTYAAPAGGLEEVRPDWPSYGLQQAQLSSFLVGWEVGQGQSTPIPDGDRGVSVALPGAGPWGGMWCFSTYPLMDPTPAEFVDYLTTSLAGTPTGTASTVFDQKPAITTSSDRAHCPTLWVFERFPRVEPERGVLTVFEVDGATVVVSIWGHTDAILNEWLPTATEFVQTFHFQDGVQ